MGASQITRMINWAAMLIALALLSVVVYQIYQRHFLGDTITQEFRFDDLPSGAIAPVSADINQIVAKHIFGQVPKAPIKQAAVVKKAPSKKEAPKTRLNITLTGIIDGATPQTGMAMLEVERGKTIVVGVGEKIGKTDAVLHQVLPGEILIERGGEIESVKMVRKTLSLASLDSQDLSSLPQAYEAPDPDPVFPNRSDPRTSIKTQTARRSDDSLARVNKANTRREKARAARELRLKERQERRARSRQKNDGPMSKLPFPSQLNRL